MALPPFLGDAASGPRTGTRVVVQSVRSGKPPLRTVVLDVELSNGDSDPRFFVLPAFLDRPVPPGALRVRAADVFELDGMPGLPIAQVHGTPSFVVMCLPPGGRARIRGLAFSTVLAVAAVEILEASAVTVGGRELASYAGSELLAPPDVRVDDAAHRFLRGSVANRDRVELPSSIDVVRRHVVPVDVPAAPEL